MFSLKEARAQAAAHTLSKGEKWIVMEVSPNAQSNQYPNNVYNSGSFIAVPRSEAMDYVAGGCYVADLML